MRGADTFTEGLFTIKKLDDFVPANHPLRVIRTMVNKALTEMGDLFAQMYEDDVKGGRPSIAPAKLLRAMLLQVLYSIRSERQLMEQTQYNLLFRWFIGLSMDASVWVHTVFTKNRERRAAHRARCDGGLLQRGAQAGRQEEVAVQGTLQRGRHPDSSLGWAQELRAQRRQGR